MIEEILNIRTERRDLRNFGLLFGAIALILAGFMFWKSSESFSLTISVGIGLILVAYTLPILLKPIYWVWMLFANILGWIMTRVILSLLFFLILTPIGFISRLFGKQFIKLELKKGRKTYWRSRSKEKYQPIDSEKQF